MLLSSDAGARLLEEEMAMPEWISMVMILVQGTHRSLLMHAELNPLPEDSAAAHLISIHGLATVSQLLHAFNLAKSLLGSPYALGQQGDNRRSLLSSSQGLALTPFSSFSCIRF